MKKILNNLRHADDIVLISKNTREVTKMGTELKTECAKVGLSLKMTNEEGIEFINLELIIKSSEVLMNTHI